MTQDVLVGCFDAQVWAREFVATLKKHPDIAADEGTMIGWFANAIMAGYDRQATEQATEQADLLAEARAEGFAACKERALAIAVGYKHAGVAANIRALSAEGGKG